MQILVLVGLVILLAIIMPVATIWSLNTLFPLLAIPLTFDTWVATIVLAGVVGGTSGFGFGVKK